MVPDNNEEYLLYQTIVGALPTRMESERELGEFVGRIQQYMEKAAHEAKINVSWLNPNPAYIHALKGFVGRILSPRWRGRANPFYDSLRKFMPAVKYFGAINSLTQTLLKFTCPGVPDVYQGQELWDFSLVDPDNRRPVDFEIRERLLDSMQQAQHQSNGNLIATIPEILRNYQDGRIKLWLIQKLLRLRQNRPDLFRHGSYTPLLAKGSKAEHVIDYARSRAGEFVIAAAPRLSFTLMKGAEAAPVGAAWNDTELHVGPEFASSSLTNLLTGERVPLRDGSVLLCSDLFAHLPFALVAG
jgi:(1->4)-alpha-D-glucan 1-alpha-D-glucosylmutase